MGYWLKLYTDILEDRKYYDLSERAKLGMFEVLLVCKKFENGELTGILPSIDDIAFHTRKTVAEWEEILPELIEIGFIEIIDDKNTVKNYIKRQSAIPDAERMKQYRKRRNSAAMENATGELRASNDPVTDCNGEYRIQNTDKETELIKQEPCRNFFTLLEEKLQIPISSDRESDYVTNLIKEYGERKLLEIADWYAGLEDRNYATWPVLRALDTAAKNWTGMPKPRKKDNRKAVFEMLDQEA